LGANLAFSNPLSGDAWGKVGSKAEQPVRSIPRSTQGSPLNGELSRLRDRMYDGTLRDPYRDNQFETDNEFEEGGREPDYKNLRQDNHLEKRKQYKLRIPREPTPEEELEAYRQSLEMARAAGNLYEEESDEDYYDQRQRATDRRNAASRSTSANNDEYAFEGEPEVEYEDPVAPSRSTMARRYQISQSRTRYESEPPGGRAAEERRAKEEYYKKQRQDEAEDNAKEESENGEGEENEEPRKASQSQINGLKNKLSKVQLAKLAKNAFDNLSEEEAKELEGLEGDALVSRLNEKAKESEDSDDKNDEKQAEDKEKDEPKATKEQIEKIKSKLTKEQLASLPEGALENLTEAEAKELEGLESEALATKIKEKDTAQKEAAAKADAAKEPKATKEQIEKIKSKLTKEQLASLPEGALENLTEAEAKELEGLEGEALATKIKEKDTARKEAAAKADAAKEPKATKEQIEKIKSKLTKEQLASLPEGALENLTEAEAKELEGLEGEALAIKIKEKDTAQKEAAAKADAAKEPKATKEQIDKIKSKLTKEQLASLPEGALENLTEAEAKELEGLEGEALATKIKEKDTARKAREAQGGLSISGFHPAGISHEELDEDFDYDKGFDMERIESTDDFDFENIWEHIEEAEPDQNFENPPRGEDLEEDDFDYELEEGVDDFDYDHPNFPEVYSELDEELALDDFDYEENRDDFNYSLTEESYAERKVVHPKPKIKEEYVWSDFNYSLVVGRDDFDYITPKHLGINPKRLKTILLKNAEKGEKGRALKIRGQRGIKSRNPTVQSRL
jgi:hypothetical protein